MPSIEFTIPGSIVSKQRPRVTKTGTYTPDKTKSYERTVAYYARIAMEGQLPIESWVSFDLSIYVLIPASFSNKKSEAALRGEIRPIIKSDIDNGFKAVADACNGIIYVDDNRICEMSAKRFYSLQPRTEVTVTWSDNNAKT